jgi:hypothetical protein
MEALLEEGGDLGRRERTVPSMLHGRSARGPAAGDGGERSTRSGGG